MDQTTMEIQDAITEFNDVLGAVINNTVYLSDSDVYRLYEALDTLRKAVEWQPMATCPENRVLIKFHNGDVFTGVVSPHLNLVRVGNEDYTISEFGGWMPLPEAK